MSGRTMSAHTTTSAAFMKSYCTQLYVCIYTVAPNTAIAASTQTGRPASSRLTAESRPYFANTQPTRYDGRTVSVA